MTKYFRLYIIFLFFTITGFSQISKVHYIPPLTNNKSTSGGSSIPLDQYMYLSTPSENNVTVTITPLNGDSPTTYNNLSNGNPIRYDIGSSWSGTNYVPSQLFVDHETTGGDTALNAGFVVEADCPIYVSIRYNAGSQAGALVSKGDASLGTNFRAGMMTNGTIQTANPHFTANSFFSVMATQDNTIVAIDLPNAIVGETTLSNYNYQGAFTKVLQKHESMVLSLDFEKTNVNNRGARNSLNGALIRSVDDTGTEDGTKPLVVNVGSASGSFTATGSGHDHGIDQIVGLDRVGHEYIFVRGNGQNTNDGGQIETPLIIGTKDNTSLYINGSNTAVATIDAGDLWLATTDLWSSQNQGATMYIRTQDKNYPVYAYQGVGGNGDSEANQGMFFVPPISEEANDDVNNIPDIDFIGDDPYQEQAGVSIVTNSDATITISENGVAYDVSLLTPVTVTGRPEYKAYTVTNLSGNVSVTSSGELYLAYFNTRGAATSGGFYAGFASPPNAEIDLGINALGNCLQTDSEGNITGSNITLQITNASGFDTYVWEKYNSDTNIWEAAPGNSTNSETYVPQTEGEYRLKGSITCLNLDQFSGIIPVSICPTDSDQDGVIDNLDLDLDNDGILNSVESSGNLVFDISLIDGPVFKNSNDEIIEITTSTNLSYNEVSTDKSTIEGFNNGEISFSLEAAINAKIAYELKNNDEPLNYRFSGKSETVTPGDYFEISVFPASKNITLVDPDDQLLIDNNYDGETFTDGITTYTANLIRFKYKNDTNNPTYQFIAYNVDGLKITAGADETTSVSEFRGLIEILDYKKNSDENETNSDDLYDYYDRDSDGDGCDDVIEAGFNYENYIGDPDSDGILGTSPLNNNNAGVINDQGLVVSHSEAGGYDINPSQNSAGNYLFQTPGSPVSITAQPSSTSGCEGSTVEFEVVASSQTEITYQWQFFNVDQNDWENIAEGVSYSGTQTSKLVLSNVSTTMDGRYRVLLNDEEYLCETGTDPNVNLSVNLAPENPIVQQIQTFCQSDTPTISSLTASNIGNNTLYWYESLDAADPLDPDTELEHNKFYYAEFVDEEGCVSNSRTESKAYLSNPVLTATNDIICVDDSTTLTIENVAKTAADFAADNDLIFITNNDEPVSWDTDYGKTYFMIQAGTGQDGFNPIDWPDAKTLTDSYNSGDSTASARMYVVLSSEMEDAVYAGLESMGLTGPDGIRFWLGLYQDLEDPSYVEPGNASQNYGGWKWVNGSYLRDTYVNWSNSEPNNAGGFEHYAQFEFSNDGKQWNDMSIGNAVSWPLFEYTGSTDIVWGYYDENGDEVILPDISTSSLEVSPTLTTTYFVKVTVNGVECIAEKTITVNPNPTAETISDLEFCDDESDNDGNNGSITIQKEIFDSLIPNILGEDQSQNDYTVTFYETNENATNGENEIIFPYTNPAKDAGEPHYALNTTQIFVRVQNNETGCFNAETSFNINIKALPITFPVDDIIICDDDRDGFISFDLESRTDLLRSGDENTDPNDIDNQSPNDFKVTYHLSIEDANDLTNTGLVSPYTNTIKDIQTIFYRIIKTEGSNSGCYKTGEAFDIIVEALPFANTVTISRECDGAAGDDSQDGIFPFDTSNIQQTLLNGQTDVTTYYYDKDDNFIGNTLPNPFETGSQIIRIQVENNTDQKCYDETTLEFIVDDSPEFYDVIIPIQCDDGNDDTDGFSEFDTSNVTQTLLTNPETSITQSLDDFTVSYQYEDENGNTINAAELPNPFNTKTQTVIATVTNKLNSSCTITKDIEFMVEDLPVANNVTIGRECDGAAGDDSQDGIFPFDTSNIQQTLLNGQTDVTTYYYDKDDNFIGNTLPNPFETGSQIIRIQVENNTDQKCYDETTLEFIVDDSPEVYDVLIDSQCDDGPSDIDGFSEFDTSTVTQTLLTNPETSITQSLDDFSVSYQYIDQNGTTINAAELPNPFNTKTQTVVATVTNKLNSSCTITKDIEFVVDPLPVIKQNIIIVEQCDDDENNDGITLHNLTEYEELFSNNYQNEQFEYYTDQALTNKIDDPTNYYNVALEDLVWVKITTENGCIRTSKTQNGDDRLQIDITVGASEIPTTFIQDYNTLYTVCDDDFGSEQDGISIFSNSVINDIVTKLRASREIFQDQNIRISLHTNSQDGLTGENPIDLTEDFINISPYTQEIWARIVNVDITTFTCLGYAKVAELYVEPRPIAYPVTIERQCDGASELDTDSQDGLFPFDTSTIINQLLTDPATGVKQDESVLTITYFNEDGSEIPASDFSPNFLTASQTITIRVEIDPSYPEIINPDGLCYDETTLEFIVDDTPEAYPVIITPHCDGDDGNSDIDGFDEFDTSNITATLLGPVQSLDDYTVVYQYIDEAGNLLSSNELRNPFNTQTQTVVATITNNVNPSCPTTMDIEFVVNPLPTFTVDDDLTVCINLPPIPIGVTSAEGDYTYTWTHTYNGVNSPFPTSGPTIFIGVGGTYFVTATDVNTGCQRTLSIFVEESETASFDLDEDGTITEEEYKYFVEVKDLTNDNNNTIRIKNLTDLGIGDYEFAIDDPTGPYQDDPFFENIRPGIHTVYIRDKKGCGIGQFDVSVIGYKKYFTPNGDGIQDTWRILGINEFFQPNSKVYIFDRYGKLLKELDPVLDGWDGTFIGRPMPQTDYWFRVFLEDGREFKGHFSLVRGFD